MTTDNLANVFSQPLLAWFDQFGRKDLPWQHPRTPYRVWIAEIMLQQTQVKTVIPYYERFIASFPDVISLCNASDDRVLAHWSGLGYYSRARNIHKTAHIICSHYSGQFPSALTELIKLPGIGPSTAAAIASQSFNLPTAILDGNVVRVLSRYFMVEGFHGESAVKKRLWQLANDCMSQERCADYTQAIMDLGATCCTRSNPNCLQCPLNTGCQAKLNDAVVQYPFKKVKKIKPTKQQQFLLLYNDKLQVYLEKRPPSGLWGGLWCLPAIDDHQCCPTDFINKHYDADTISTTKLLDIKHSFSHFNLDILAVAIQIKPRNQLIREAKGQWFHITEFQGLGLAKPVSDILDYFLNRSSPKIAMASIASG